MKKNAKTNDKTDPVDARPTKEDLMIRISNLVSMRGTCKRLHVGCVITNLDSTEIVSYGYNGNYAGGPNECDGDEAGKCGCVHAEVNALIKAGRRGVNIFLTDAPCLACSKLIINSGIPNVFYWRDYRLTEGIDLLKEEGVNVTQINL